MPRLDEAAWVAVRAEYEAGDGPVRELAARHGISHVTLWKRARGEGWLRPGETPPIPAGAADGKLLARLFHAFDRQVADLEKRFEADGGAIEEKDARTLSVLAKTFETLAKLRDEREGAAGDAAVDIDELRARLARRLAALDPRRAAGGDSDGGAGEGNERGGDRRLPS